METTVAISLPKEIWNLILGYCKVELAKRLQFALVCKSWKTIVTQITTEVNLRDKSGRHLDKITDQFPYLEKIILPKFGDGLSSLTCLKNLPHLHSLSLIYKPLRLVDQSIRDFSIYAALTQLTHLTVGESKEDLLKLSTLTNLVSLDLKFAKGDHFKWPTDVIFNMMKDMTRLTCLCTPEYAWWENNCSEKISHLTNLKTLIVERPGSASIGIDMLSNLVHLEHVDITFGHRQQEIEHIRHWTNLTSLTVDASIVHESFHHLTTLQKIRHFTFMKNEIPLTLFLTAVQWPELHQITFEGTRWPDDQPPVNPYAEEEAPNDDSEDGDKVMKYIESEQTRARWDLLSSMTHLTSLKRLIGLPYHRALDTRIKFFPQSLTSLSVECMYDESKVFYRSLLHFTNLAALNINDNSGSVNNDTIDILSHLPALKVLHIESSEYDGDYYRSWKYYKDNPTPGRDPASLDLQFKVLAFPRLNISSFARLTQLTSLYVSQDPFEEEELWTLTMLRNLKRITLGWHFNTQKYLKFINN